MRHPDYPFWTFVSLVLVLLPVPWHWRARNIATVSLVFWLALANLASFVNTIVWADNYVDRSPVWCDISSRISLLASYAVPLCSLAQMRRLESVASTRRSIISGDARKRRIWGEIVLCLFFPVVLTALQYVVQGHRYDLIEGVGCVSTTYMSAPGLIIRFLVPTVIALISLVYAALAVRWFLIRRLQFRTILASSDSRLSVGRYFRLIALAVTDSTVVLAVIIYAVVHALTASENPVRSYESWTSVHKDFAQVSQFPEELFASTWPAVVVNVYAPILYSILFFTFFGFGEEAVLEYLALGASVKHCLENWGVRQKQVQTSFGDRQLDLGSKIMPAGDSTAGGVFSTGAIPDDTSEKGFHTIETRSEALPPQGGLDIAVRVERSIV